jgi:hypothetical protein
LAPFYWIVFIIIVLANPNQMKKLLLLLLFPFVIKCQTPPVDAVGKPNAISLHDQAKLDAKKRIEGYREQVVKGASMDLMAKTYSQDPGSAKNGGLYAGIVKGQMVEEFEKVLFDLKKPGDISEVFETQYGFHFIQLVNDNGQNRDCRHLLITF